MLWYSPDWAPRGDFLEKVMLEVRNEGLAAKRRQRNWEEQALQPNRALCGAGARQKGSRKVHHSAWGSSKARSRPGDSRALRLPKVCGCHFKYH